MKFSKVFDNFMENKLALTILIIHFILFLLNKIEVFFC
jgi:hypothetical protein